MLLVAVSVVVSNLLCLETTTKTETETKIHGAACAHSGTTPGSMPNTATPTV
jgi:hypothetical protein